MHNTFAECTSENIPPPPKKNKIKNNFVLNAYEDATNHRWTWWS